MATSATARKKTAPAAAVPAPRKRITTESVAVTPEMAKEWLKRNVSNRRLQEATVLLYAGDMKIDEWVDNGETIKFSGEGDLLDGQHRLHAVIRSGKTVEMLVVRGLARKAQETMDVGRKRNASDTLMLRGETNTVALAAILRRITLWDKGDRSFRGIASMAEMSAKLEKHPEIRRSAEIAVRTRKTFKDLPVSSLGVAHHLLFRVSPEQVPWFFQKIAVGTELGEGNPVYVLRERARSDKDAGNAVSDVRALALIIRAWNVYRKGETITRLQHAKDAPVPDPK